MPTAARAFVFLFTVLAAPALAEPARTDLPHFGITVTVPDGAVLSTKQIEHAIMTAVRIPNGIGDIVVQEWRLGEAVRSAGQGFEKAGIGVADLEWRYVSAALGLAFAAPDFAAAANGTPAGRMRTPIVTATVVGRAARIVTLDLLPTEQQPDRIVKTFCILPRADERYLVFDHSAAPEHADRGIDAFRAFLASITALDGERDGDTSVASAERSAVDFLLDLTPADYEAAAAAAADRFERLTSTDPATGEITEHGYRRTRFWIGAYGELTGKDPARWRRQDERRGVLMRANAKIFLPAGDVATTESLAFLHEDRREEFWSLTVAVERRGQKRPDVFKEHGFRDGVDMTISIDAGDGEVAVVNPDLRLDDINRPALELRSGARVERPTVRIEGLLSRVERELLPYLMAGRADAGTYAFHAYDSQVEAIAPIGVILAPAGGDAGAAWTMTLPPAADTLPPRVLSLDDRGVPRETRLSDGRVWRPVDPKELAAIYRAKGLPTD